MRLRCIAGAFALSLVCLAAARNSWAVSVFSLSGQVELADGAVPDGTRVKLQVDVDRNGKLDSFETLTATVGAGGSYKLTYDLNPKDVDFKFVAFVTALIADYNERGFEALLDDGPLPVFLSVEREGYSTVTKRLSSMFESPNLDVVLAPLSSVNCANSNCFSPNGGVRLSGFPGGTGIARAFAEAYDPSIDTARFPGLFTDNADNLLVSSGFAEINLFDQAGKPVHSVSAPVTTRFEAKRESWSTLPDLTENSGRIELPLYSFNQTTGEWVREGDGELQLADGTPVLETDLAAIRGGTFAENVFVSFKTTHFSTFNCDAPIKERACVKGRVVSSVDGSVLVGVQVSVPGVSYTGSAGTVFTGADGSFATDVMKSELAGEDVDGNRKVGETFTARVSAGAAAGAFLGNPFNTPTVVGSVKTGTSKSCRPQGCNCLDLGDIVTDFEAPRLCHITVQATASGKSNTEEPGPLAKGEMVVGAKVRGEVTGSSPIPQGSVQALCQGIVCKSGTLDAQGSLKFAVPVIGPNPQIRVNADFSIKDSDGNHYYSGSIVVAGCARGEETLTANVSVQLDHAELADMGSFIGSLGPASSPSPSNPINPARPGSSSDINNPKRGCGCRTVGVSDNDSSALIGLLGLGLVLVRRRKYNGHDV